MFPGVWCSGSLTFIYVYLLAHNTHTHTYTPVSYPLFTYSNGIDSCYALITGNLYGESSNSDRSYGELFILTFFAYNLQLEQCLFWFIYMHVFFSPLIIALFMFLLLVTQIYLTYFVLDVVRKFYFFLSVFSVNWLWKNISSNYLIQYSFSVIVV